MQRGMKLAYICFCFSVFPEIDFRSEPHIAMRLSYGDKVLSSIVSIVFKRFSIYSLVIYFFQNRLKVGVDSRNFKAKLSLCLQDILLDDIFSEIMIQLL